MFSCWIILHVEPKMSELGADRLGLWTMYLVLYVYIITPIVTVDYSSRVCLKWASPRIFILAIVVTYKDLHGAAWYLRKNLIQRCRILRINRSGWPLSRHLLRCRVWLVRSILTNLVMTLSSTAAELENLKPLLVSSCVQITRHCLQVSGESFTSHRRRIKANQTRQSSPFEAVSHAGVSSP